MARRRVIHEEEEKEEKTKKPAFKPSEFDETEFLQTENKSAKMIYISLAVALLAGIASFILMRVVLAAGSENYNTVPIIVPFIFAPIALWAFGKFGIDIKELEWKKYLENGFMFVLAWFAVWMVSMNPPFSDFSDPLIEDLVIVIDTDSGKQVTYIDTDTETIMFVDDVEKVFESTRNLTDVSHVELFVPITDNWNLEDVDVKISEKVGSTWSEIENLEENDIFKGWNDSFDPEGNVSDTVEREWVQREKDVWEGHLYSIKFDFTDIENTTYDHQDGIELRIEIDAEDSQGNTSKLVYDIRIFTS